MLNSLSKVVYSTCNLCKKHPERPPLWQIRAASATEDLEHKRIEYTDAEMQMFGIPVAYFPYFWTAEPSSKRTSGLLIPRFGISSHIGAFFAQPYYWVIDDQSDATFTPMLTTNAGPEIDVEYRRRFNFGFIDAQRLRRDISRTRRRAPSMPTGYSISTTTWRAGFDVNRASSADYRQRLTTWATSSARTRRVLTSNIYRGGIRRRRLFAASERASIRG